MNFLSQHSSLADGEPGHPGALAPTAVVWERSPARDSATTPHRPTEEATAWEIGPTADSASASGTL